MGEGKGGEYVTRYEAEKIMTEGLRSYERETVEPRHKETQGSLAEVKNLVQQGIGASKAASVVVTLAGVVWIVIQIVQASKH